jgi:hypothetical protein
MVTFHVEGCMVHKVGLIHISQAKHEILKDPLGRDRINVSHRVRVPMCHHPLLFSGVVDLVGEFHLGLF